jgi:uncharacterized protein YbbC (DUF1343 family)
MQTVQTGLEQFVTSPPKWITNCRLGLLCNPASIDRHYRHARMLIDNVLPGRLAALYAPQHGFMCEKQDNMIESEDMLDPVLKKPVFSLYGKTRKPTREMFDPIDALIVDLQDVGTRVYTFIYTMSYCLEAAKRWNKKVLVLDRPNPIGGLAVEGNVLSSPCASFVGRYPMPMRHGLTIGELALLFNRQYGIDCDLTVLPMVGWHRSMFFMDTGLPWVAPSPNLPTPVSAMVYPGQVLWEGTNISEGRGTTQPFEIFGAPFLDPAKIIARSGGRCMDGIALRELAFQPTSNKWKNQLCPGFQIHITNPFLYQPYLSTLKLLQAVIFCHPDQFAWKRPPYEYEFEKQPIDLIIGNRDIRERLERLEDTAKIAALWQEELEAFKTVSRRLHLY